MHSHERVVLIVEDDEYKLRALLEYVATTFPSCRTIGVQALTTAISHIENGDIWFAIVDMSIPTYETANNLVDAESGQTFGGEDVLRFIKSKRRNTFSVVVTQYPEFEDTGTGRSQSIHELEAKLLEILGPKFLGVIHYAGQHGEWRRQLSAAFERAKGD